MFFAPESVKTHFNFHIQCMRVFFIAPESVETILIKKVYVSVNVVCPCECQHTLFKLLLVDAGRSQ